MRGICTWPLAALTAACYQPTIEAGAPCETSQQCPGEQACIDHVCGGGGPTAPDAAPGIDAPLDASPDATPNQVVTIGTQPGQVRDTEITGVDPTLNLGAVDHVSVDTDETSLVWFDLTSIATTRKVLGATLIVTVADEASNDGGTVTIHRMRESWIEGEATFLLRSNGLGWSTNGARPPSRDAIPVTAFQPAAVNTTYMIALPPGLVQEWVATPSINRGLAFVRGTSVEHVHLRSRESGVWSKLTVELEPN